MVYVVEGERVGCRMGAWLWMGARFWNVSVADFWRENHDGMEVRWRSDGAWWSGLVLNKERVKKNTI